jgi:signal transduction histidine kinase
LPSLECSGGYNPAAWRAADGTLWFTTLKGAVSIQPRAVQLNTRPPAVLIEQVLAEGNSIWPTSTNAQPENTPLQIAPGRGQMEFHFAGLSLSSPERVKYRYQLLGEDNEWVEAGARRFAHYASLRPDKYRFRVTACNGDGVWNPQPAEVLIEVLPHFYETWWFYALLTTLIIGGAFAVARHRFNLKLRRQTEQMERRHEIERERARIAKDIHDDLGSSLTLIAVMGDLARQNQDGERIGKISTTARQAVKSLDEIVWAVNPRNDSLAQLVDYVCGYAGDYLAAAEIRCRLDVPDQIPPVELSSKIRHNVFLAAKESLQNIVKHSQAKEAGLKVEIHRHRVKIFIADNGRGFTAEPDDAFADGLRNLRQRMIDIGGQCEIAAQSGGGTEVLLEFPLP